MKLVIFLNTLGLGGTEKAACRWAWGLKDRGHEVAVMTLVDGPRRRELEARGVEIALIPATAEAVGTELQRLKPEAIHVHAPGQPHIGDVLGAALAQQPKIPVVQTNIFGRFQNPEEDAWTDFRLFISWTSCVQAARRSFRPLNEAFFHHASVAVYPVDPVDASPTADAQRFRSELGIAGDEVLFGRLSRPDPNKWTPLAVEAFELALRHHRGMKLLLREPPRTVAEQLRASPLARHFLILPATAEEQELRLTMSALDAVLHTSSIGESFGYGIAEPMNLGKPVITHSVPWEDQAQLELVRHGECGLVASTPSAMADAVLRLAGDASSRERLGAAGRKHIRQLGDAATSIERLEHVLQAAAEGRDNPFASADFQRAREAATYLDEEQFGHSVGEQFALRLRYHLARFHQWRHVRSNTAGNARQRSK